MTTASLLNVSNTLGPNRKAANPGVQTTWLQSAHARNLQTDTQHFTQIRGVQPQRISRMGTPADYLPGKLSNEAIIELSKQLGLSVPSKIESLKVTAEYHSIYLLRYEGDSAAKIPVRKDADESVTLVLRVSGRHLPRIKTLNEVGVMTWVRRNTNIPVPAVLRFSADTDNAIGHEFTLLERVPGTSLDKIYDGLTGDDKRKIVEQLVDFLVELHSKPWPRRLVGGLLLKDGAITPGPPLEETFWQVPDIEKYWLGESLESLNPLEGGPFDGYTSYTTAALRCYIHAIGSHPSLEGFRSMVPQMEQFVTVINSDRYKSELDNVKYILAHKDLHFGNIMCDPADPDLPITAVLDWEFSGVVPATRWNPVRAFLWNGKRDVQSEEEHAKMEGLFERVCAEKGAVSLLEDVKSNSLQESMQTAVNHIRAVVEVCPRGQAQDKVEGWRRTAEAAMAVFI